MLTHGTLYSSRVVQGVSGLRSSSGGEFELFLEDQHERQASHPVVSGYLGFHWSRCRGIRTYLKLKGHSVYFFLEAGSAGSTQDSTGETGCGMKLSIPLTSGWVFWGPS